MYRFKWKGKSCFGPPRRVPLWQAFLSWATSFVGIALVGILNQYALLGKGFPILYGSE